MYYFLLCRLKFDLNASLLIIILQDKIILLFKNVDTYICKKLGFVYDEALQIRNVHIIRQAYNMAN